MGTDSGCSTRYTKTSRYTKGVVGRDCPPARSATPLEHSCRMFSSCLLPPPLTLPPVVSPKAAHSLVTQGPHLGLTRGWGALACPADGQAATGAPKVCRSRSIVELGDMLCDDRSACGRDAMSFSLTPSLRSGADPHSPAPLVLGEEEVGAAVGLAVRAAAAVGAVSAVCVAASRICSSNFSRTMVTMSCGSGTTCASLTTVRRLEPAYERKEKETPKSRGVVPK